MGVDNGAKLADRSSEQYFAESQKELRIADHMAYVTSPLLTDSNLFASTVNHLYKSILYSVMGFLKNEMDYKRLFALPRENKDKVEFFVRRYAQNMGIETEMLNMVRRMTVVGSAAGSSYKQFSRNNKMVFMSQNFSVEEIDKDSVKKYLSLQKKFILKVKENLRR